MGQKCHIKLGLFQIKMSQNIITMRNVKLIWEKSIFFSKNQPTKWILKLEHFVSIFSFNQHLFCKMRLKSHFQGSFLLMSGFVFSLEKKVKIEKKGFGF